MTKPLIDARTDAALASLDPARDVAVSAERYESTLARIVAVDVTEPADVVVRPLPLTRRARRRLVAIPAGALAIAAAVVAVAAMVGGQPAYADWTPVPTALPLHEAAEATRSCLAHQGEVVTSAVEPLIADRRGPWIYVLITTSATDEVSCLMPEDLVGTLPSSADRRMYAGGSGDALTDPVAPRQVEVSTSTASATDEGLFLLIEGRVGSEVQSVAVVTATGMRVTASVHHGRFAAWWPGGDTSPRNPEVAGAPTLEVTMIDGTIVTMPC